MFVIKAVSIIIIKPEITISVLKMGTWDYKICAGFVNISIDGYVVDMQCIVSVVVYGDVGGCDFFIIKAILVEFFGLGGCPKGCVKLFFNPPFLTSLVASPTFPYTYIAEFAFSFPVLL